MTLEQLEAKILDSLYQFQKPRPDGIVMMTEESLHTFLGLAYQCGRINGGLEEIRKLNTAINGKVA